MISAKLNGLCRRKNIVGYIRNNSRYSAKKTICLAENNDIKKHENINKQPTIFSQKLDFNDTTLLNRFTILSCSSRGFCTENLPKHPNVFGDLAYEKYEKVEMDENEAAEEEFVENEVRIPRRLKPSTGQYSKMIKDHVNRGDLPSAIAVLDLIKQNRDKPTTYMYNLLIRAAAVQTDMKQAFKLYNDMKKRALKPNEATYTSLINACATSKNSAKALEQLTNLRQRLHEQGFPLNATHYNALIKAYGWHNKVLEAFQIADLMKDNEIPIDETTFNTLLHASISDKESGLRHTLMVWHLMHKCKVKPSVITYNLLLRAIRDTKCGDLRENDFLVTGVEESKIYLEESERPDLLASPPALSNLRIPYQDTSLGSNRKPTKEQLQPLASLRIDDILVNNRLLLFGGFEGILKRMDADNVKADIKTITLLMELVPNFAAAEDAVAKSARVRKINLDADYYNILIRKRCMRFKYDSAKEVLGEMQRDGISPNIMTFGVLAMSCTRPKDGRELIEGMETIGFAPNAVIMGTLIANACNSKYFTYCAELLDYMYDNRINPNKKLIENLAKFEENMEKIVSSKGRYDKQKMADLKERFEKFQTKYHNWLKKWELREKKRQLRQKRNAVSK